MEMLVLMYIPLTYLTVAMIWKGAYTSKKVKNPNVYIPMFGLVVLFNWFVIGQSIWSGVFVIVEDGMLATSSGILFTTIFFTLATIAMIMRRAADLRMLRAES